MNLLLVLQMSHIEQLIQQGITFCVEAGKSILVALLIYIVGRFLVSFLNKLLTKALERRNIDPTIKTFLQSFVNILLTVLLIVAVVSALGVDIQMSQYDGFDYDKSERLIAIGKTKTLQTISKYEGKV